MKQIVISVPDGLHEKTAQLIADFAAALAEKAHAAQQKYGVTDNWATDDWKADCERDLLAHLAKGDPRDVALYCAFMWSRGWRTPHPAAAPSVKALTDSQHDLIVAMQAAFIEWRHGKGAEAAMNWIGNTLAGPGLIPAEDEPYGKEAQAYWSANNSHPFPQCACGRPSSMMGAGVAGCCSEHFEAAKRAKAPAAIA